ncbi:MAG: metallophosphoesterase [Ferruginibacter sp.]
MTSRRYFIMQGALATTAMFLPKYLLDTGNSGTFFLSGRGTGNSVTLLHTNDLHNQLLPHNYGNFSQLGGFEHTANCISRIKQEIDNVVLVDAGDVFSGKKEDQDKYEKTLELMMAAGYDAALPGNRDYEAGTDFLQEQMTKHNLPLLSTNYSFTESWLKNLHQPYKIVQKGDIKIGIVGAGIDMKDLAPAHVNEQVKCINPINSIYATATMLKEQKKCNLVICISHLGYKNKNKTDDISLASQSKNIDVIIGGHSHHFMQSPQIVLNRQQQEVIINHAGYGGMVLGNINIVFDDYGKKQQVSFNNLMIGTNENKWAINQYAST